MRFLPIILLLLISDLAHSQEAWKLHKEDGRLKIFTRGLDDGNRGFEVKLEMEIAADMYRIKSHLENMEAYPDWIHRCKSAKMLRKVSESEYYYYSLINLPIPFSDREVVAVVNESRDENTGQIIRTISSRPDFVPKNKGKVRVQRYESTWTLTPLNNGKTHISCIVYSDAGKGLPQWFRTKIVSSGCSKTLHNFAALAER